ncbi:MAG: dihydroxy-acid dehydratase, partial [Myxococcota bacterium]
ATVAGPGGLARYVEVPTLIDEVVSWAPVGASGDESIVRPAARPFDPEGGLRVVRGNLGEAIIKTSAVARGHRVVQAPARVFASQEALQESFAQGTLTGDFVAVIPFQGPRANGMPELHRLTPVLTTLQSRGQSVALVTDGRMSGASGKVLAAIHVTPEAAMGGPLAKVRDGDVVRLDAERGELQVLVDEATWRTREAMGVRILKADEGWGRELFASLRSQLLPASAGAGLPQPDDLA